MHRANNTTTQRRSTMQELPQVPAQPALGSPCNGCGYCCQQELCQLGIWVYGPMPAPCPAFTWIQGRYWCAWVLAEYEARRQDPSVLPRIADALGIGMGCYSDGPA